MYKCRSRLCLFMIINDYMWLLVIIKWLFVIILLWHVSIVCINVVAGLLFFVYLWLLMIINDYYYDYL